MGPATVVVFLIVGVLFLLGVLIINAGKGGRRPGPTCASGHTNPPGARYCARCGKKLTEADSQIEKGE